MGAVLTCRRIVDIRFTENSGEVAKYVTKPGAYLKLDGAGAWWCDPERLETLHYVLGSRRVHRLVAVAVWNPA